MRPVADIFFEDLISQLVQWKGEVSKVLMMGDFNENVYTEKLASRLAEDDLRMEEQVRKSTGEEIPSTHVQGSKPVCVVYTTSGVSCMAATVLP